MRKILILFFSLISISLFGKEFVNNPFNYSVDLPAEWSLVDGDQTSFTSFSDSSGHIVLQIGVFPKTAFPDIDSVFTGLTENIDVNGEYDYFLFNGYDSILAEMTYPIGTFTVTGYSLYTESEEYYYYLTAFSPTDEYEQTMDSILSVINSFFLNNQEYVPGPVSQFYYPSENISPSPYTINIGGESYTINFDTNQIEANQVVIEREARLLAAAPQDYFKEDWQRYYRIIYRDCFMRIKPINNFLESTFSLKDYDAISISNFFLDFVQSFTYSRNNYLSDLDSPIKSFLSQTGDCDSQSLLLNLLLQEYNIDSILLVSSQFSHALAGILLPVEGASYLFEEKDYIIAETTDDVALGLINRDMADPAGWIPVRF